MSDPVSIPRSWLQTRVGDITDYAKVERVEPDEIPSDSWVLELEDIEKDTSRLIQRLTFSQRKSKSSKNKFKTGDILYGKLRPYLNKVLIADQDGYCTTEIIPIRANEAIIGRFLFYWLKTTTFLNYVTSVSYGLNMPRLGTEDGLRAPIVVAPLNEQRRIADKLDVVLSRVAECQAHLERVPQILRLFRQAVLAATTSGRLTEEWREEHGLSTDSWQTRTGEEIFPFITSGPRGWAPYYADSGAIFIRVGNLERDTIDLDLEQIQYVKPPDNAEGKRTQVKVGDILISITADIGMVAFIREDIGEAYVNQHICLARQTGNYSGSFLAYYLASPLGGLSQLVKVQRGVTKAGLTLGDIRALKFQIPHRQEQDEIVRRVEKLFAIVGRLEARYQTIREAVDRITPSLLGKAFRGELVQHDPNDEPASVLLERIRAVRAMAPKETKKSRRRSEMGSTKDHKDGKRVGIIYALQETGGELAADQLFLTAGYPVDADSELVEDFFVEVRDAIRSNKITKKRAGETDWFILVM